MELLDITTIKEISLKHNIPITTLKTRLELKSFDLVENVDYRKMGQGQGILFTPIGAEKIIKKGWSK